MSVHVEALLGVNLGGTLVVGVREDHLRVADSHFRVGAVDGAHAHGGTPVVGLNEALAGVGDSNLAEHHPARDHKAVARGQIIRANRLMSHDGISFLD